MQELSKEHLQRTLRLYSSVSELLQRSQPLQESHNVIVTINAEAYPPLIALLQGPLKAQAPKLLELPQRLRPGGGAGVVIVAHGPAVQGLGN